MIRELHLQGMLSFSPNSQPLQMQSLNILVGPNGSGKSNLIEALGLLRASPKDLSGPMKGRGGGGIGEWIWKGKPEDNAHVEVVIDYPEGQQPLRHVIEFREETARLHLVDERIESQAANPGADDPFFFYRYQKGTPVLSVRDGSRRGLQREDVAVDQSILSQRQDPDSYPELAYLSEQYRNWRFYREWSFGRSSVFRAPQAADLPTDSLAEDFSNLGLFLNHLRGQPKVKKAILSSLRDLYKGLDDFDVRVKGGTVEVLLAEVDFVIPASRLSDGTLRYLTLLAILCDPSPPSLICIEEPELGLHPDMLPRIADLIIEASKRTQLIVTTHSDILVDAMTGLPEAVVIVEKHLGGTVMRRLDRNELSTWLDKYRLGQLWTDGEIGGVRW